MAAIWPGKAIMRRHTLAAVLFSTLPVPLGFAGCTDDSPTAPRTGALLVTTSTTGDTLDWNGYALVVGAAVPRAIGIDATVAISNLLPGDVTVELGDVAVNCSVSGDNPREVNLVAGGETATRFEVDCRAAPFNRIAFSSNRGGGASDIFVMEPDGSNPINLTRDPSGPASYPDWSPDATRIAFASSGGGGIGDSDVYVIDADGANLRRLTQNAGVELSAWSPDGSRIAYSSFTEPVQGESWGDIYVMDADGSNPINLTPGPARGVDPAWSPDGTRIAYEDLLEIVVVEADGSNPVCLTCLDGGVAPAWSPPRR